MNDFLTKWRIRRVNRMMRKIGIGLQFTFTDDGTDLTSVSIDTSKCIVRDKRPSLEDHYI